MVLEKTPLFFIENLLRKKVISIRTYRNIRKIKNEFRIGPFDKTSAKACGLTFIALLPITIPMFMFNKEIQAAVVAAVIILPVFAVTRFTVPEGYLPFGSGTKIYQVMIRYLKVKIFRKKVIYTNLIEEENDR